MGNLDNLGIFSTHEIRPSLVQKYFDKIRDRPGKQAATMSALRALEKWAIVNELLPRQISYGVEIKRPKGGHTPWTEDQVEQAEKYARPEISRVITLGATTGQRVSDLIRMGWGDIETFRGVRGIAVTQVKTGTKLWIPIEDHLASVMKNWAGPEIGCFLIRSNGEFWTERRLKAVWHYERKTNKHLAEHQKLGLVIHGLRAHRCVMLSRAGKTDHEIGQVIGMTARMVERYTRFSSQRENALAAMGRLERK